MCTRRMPMAAWIQSDCASRSRYSLVRSACVTPSTASTYGHAQSYVGYALNALPVRWCGVSTLQRKATGSRSVLFSALMSILKRRQQRQPATLPASISAHMARFFSTLLARQGDSMPSMRCARISSTGVSST